MVDISRKIVFLHPAYAFLIFRSVEKIKQELTAWGFIPHPTFMLPIIRLITGMIGHKKH